MSQRDPERKDNHRVVVIGAGVGGLTAAALLARNGAAVTVLEAHIYPGGCAGTFYHRGYRFDAGATLAGGYAPGAPMDRLAAELAITWPARPAEPAMVVHLGEEVSITRWGNTARWESERRASFGPASEPFWRWQERTADVLWKMVDELPAWPPQTLRDVARLSRLAGRYKPRQLMSLASEVPRRVKDHLPAGDVRLRRFVDAQLLIAAQATSERVTALYGAACLDLPRRGVVHLDGGMGAVAETLAGAVRRYGGTVRYRQEVTRIVLENRKPIAVETRGGESYPAQVVIANLPPSNVAALWGEQAPRSLSRWRNREPWPQDGWGAFMLYVGLREAPEYQDLPLHHQVVGDGKLAEGHSAFISLSPAGDASRAPAGYRAVTLSTHTAPGPWWELHEHDRPAYDARVATYTERLLASAEAAVPGFRERAELILPGTPVTFQRYTRRHGGWVGGYPQTHLLRAGGPRVAPGVWLVGDSIFPGQSTAAVALGGIRVAREVMAEQ
jgi:C-3',4' desaturase CrtD